MKYTKSSHILNTKSTDQQSSQVIKVVCKDSGTALSPPTVAATSSINREEKQVMSHPFME